MANLYVLRGGGQKGTISFAVHMTIPATPNKAGVNYSDIFPMSSFFTGRSVVPSGDGTSGTIDNTERLAILNGTRFEFTADFAVPGTWDADTAGNRGTALDQWSGNLISDYATRIQNELDYIGLTR